MRKNQNTEDSDWFLNNVFLLNSETNTLQNLWGQGLLKITVIHDYYKVSLSLSIHNFNRFIPINVQKVKYAWIKKTNLWMFWFGSSKLGAFWKVTTERYGRRVGEWRIRTQNVKAKLSVDITTWVRKIERRFFITLRHFYLIIWHKKSIRCLELNT